MSFPSVTFEYKGWGGDESFDTDIVEHQGELETCLRARSQWRKMRRRSEEDDAAAPPRAAPALRATMNGLASSSSSSSASSVPHLVGATSSSSSRSPSSGTFVASLSASELLRFPSLAQPLPRPPGATAAAARAPPRADGHGNPPHLSSQMKATSEFLTARKAAAAHLQERVRNAGRGFSRRSSSW